MIIGRSINQTTNVFVWKTMTLRSITWTYNLIELGVIKRCCSIHVIKNLLILLLGKQK